VVVVIMVGDANRALNAANGRADRTTHDSPDRTCRAITFVRAFFGAANNSLGLCCQRHGKNSNRQ
jgi:hypothetical protein